MEGGHPKWGPDLDQYFDTLDKRMDKAFDNYIASRETTSVAHDGLPPLSVLETMLTVGENMHRVKYQHGEKSLPVLMRTIREYLKITGYGIFDYYYGYLCMRHLMRTICIGTLLESETLSEFLDNFDSNDDSVEVNGALEEEALEQMTECLFQNDVSYIAVCLGLTSGCWTAFPCVGGIDFDDIEFLIMTLWDNRRQLITLIEHGYVSGFPSLLFTLSEMTMFNRGKPESTKKWIELEEIILRAFLVGTREERKLYRQLALYAHHRIQDHKMNRDIDTDDEDARTVVRAYVEMFRPFWGYDKSLAPLMMLDVSGLLFKFAADMLSAEMEDCSPDVAWAGLERLWLEYDRETDAPLAPNKPGFIRRYSSDVFCVISEFKNSIIAQRTHQEFDKAMQKANLLALIGRTLLLISRDNGEPDDWPAFRKDLKLMPSIVYGRYPVAKLSVGAYWVEWTRVQEQLLMLLFGVAPSNLPKQYISEAIKAWSVFAPFPAGNKIRWRSCWNPRCAIDQVFSQMPEAKHICGKCAKAIYCSRRCQSVHWALPTSESHKILCEETEIPPLQ